MHSVSFDVFLALASLGSGWLFAIYMWHLYDAAVREGKPWETSNQDQDKDHDV
jgi:hypothetical protein